MEQKAPSETVTHAGQLRVGVMFNGVRHVEFEVRAPVIEDQLQALVAVGQGEGEGGSPLIRNARMELAMLAQQLVRLGDIPTEEVTLDFLLGSLPPEDFDALFEASEKAKKKRLETPKHSAAS
ncbi:hypothetical protein LBW59_11780 [Ralstonia solanacearum]|uniref:Uncharacterized protein n=1 Tax=Ralstonia solanacearum TaxID=305 RepID=A0AAW5ZN97_RALSL|nr:hypothetical protein [Ralstonia solanacearum]MDB0571449.1 hypothetical protein [Ralstonia solanacearum]